MYSGTEAEFIEFFSFSFLINYAFNIHVLVLENFLSLETIKNCSELNTLSLTQLLSLSFKKLWVTNAILETWGHFEIKIQKFRYCFLPARNLFMGHEMSQSSIIRKKRPGTIGTTVLKKKTNNKHTKNELRAYICD